MKLSEFKEIIEKYNETKEIDENSSVYVRWYANSENGEVEAEIENVVVDDKNLILKVK